MIPELETVQYVVNTMSVGGDILGKLWNALMPSHEAAMKPKECDDQMEQFRFKEFNGECEAKDMKGISIKKFQDFVARTQKAFGLSEKAAQSLLDGLDTDENKGVLKSFKFDEGKGKIFHGEYLTAKKNEKIDVAYAIYNANFKLSEKDWAHSYSQFGHKAEAQALTSDLEDTLSKWGEAKVAETWSKVS